MPNKEQIISETLKTIGIPCHFKGFLYLKDAISMAVDDFSVVHSVTKTLYPAIAEKHSTKPGRVERSIFHAVELAWDESPDAVLKEVFGPRASDNRKLTAVEVIATIAEKVRLQLMQKAG